MTVPQVFNDHTEEPDYPDTVAEPGAEPGYCRHCGHPIRTLLAGSTHTETMNARCRAFTT